MHEVHCLKNWQDYLMIWGYAEFKTLFHCIKVGRKILSQNWEDFRMPSLITRVIFRGLKVLIGFGRG